jgi:hypothetical protein
MQLAREIRFAYAVADSLWRKDRKINPVLRYEFVQYYRKNWVTFNSISRQTTELKSVRLYQEYCYSGKNYKFFLRIRLKYCLVVYYPDWLEPSIFSAFSRGSSGVVSLKGNDGLISNSHLFTTHTHLPPLSTILNFCSPYSYGIISTTLLFCDGNVTSPTSRPRMLWLR